MSKIDQILKALRMVRDELERRTPSPVGVIDGAIRKLVALHDAAGTIHKRNRLEGGVATPAVFKGGINDVIHALSTISSGFQNNGEDAELSVEEKNAMGTVENIPAAQDAALAHFGKEFPLAVAETDLAKALGALRRLEAVLVKVESYESPGTAAHPETKDPWQTDKTKEVGSIVAEAGKNDGPVTDVLKVETDTEEKTEVKTEAEQDVFGGADEALAKRAQGETEDEWPLDLSVWARRPRRR